MFPKYVVLTTKHTPATPTNPEKNEVLNWGVADTRELAEQLAAENTTISRKAHVPAGVFGPGVPQIASAIFEQSKPAE